MFLQSITPYLTEGIAFLANIIHPVRVSYKCLLTDHSEKRRVLLRSLSEDNENPEISAVTQVRCLILIWIYVCIHSSSVTVRSWFALGTLEFDSVVWFGLVGAVQSTYRGLCADG